MQKNGNSKETLIREAQERIRIIIEQAWAGGAESGKDMAMSRILQAVEGERVPGGSSPPAKAPQPAPPVRALARPPAQRTLPLNRAAAGSIQEIAEKLLIEDVSPQGLIPSRAVALAKARHHIVVKESSMRMAFFGLAIKKRAVQNSETRTWFHITRKSAAVAAGSGGAAGSERAARDAVN
jgi:hypothetical protein